jgi:CRP-like cAMP-binding protein
MSQIEEWANQLGRSEVFEVLSQAVRQRLAASGSPIRLTHGQRLFSAGDAGDAAYLVISGELEVQLSRSDGSETYLARIRPGAVIGDMAVLDGGKRSADVVASRTSQLLRFGRQAVLDALAEEPQAALRLLAVLVGRLRETNTLVEESTALDLGARLARVLLGESGPVTRSQSDLARLVSGSRESVNRKLSVWRGEGWIEIGTRGIILRDRDALARVAGLVGDDD